MSATNGDARRRLLLVWDEPNIKISRRGLVRAAPRRIGTVGIDRIADWLVNRAGRRGLSIDATVFVNVPPAHVEATCESVHGIRSAGFTVYARPKRASSDDVDSVMVDHVRAALAVGNVDELIIASHDRR